MIAFLCGMIGFFLGIKDASYWTKYYQSEVDRYQKLWLLGLEKRNELCKRIIQLEAQIAAKKTRRKPVAKKRIRK